MKENTNNILKNDLIGEYQNFILAAASKVLKRSVMTSDDEYIIAMMAFGDAIDDYNENKGNFLGFAKTVIRNRIIDSAVFCVGKRKFRR